MDALGETTDSPIPVMTFDVAGHRLGVPIHQMDQIAAAPQIWPVPFSRPEHWGLLETAAGLVPVMSLPNVPQSMTSQLGGSSSEPLVAILHVRDVTVALRVDRPWRVFEDYRHLRSEQPAPAVLQPLAPQLAGARESTFWIIDPDRLWMDTDGQHSHAT